MDQPGLIQVRPAAKRRRLDEALVPGVSIDSQGGQNHPGAQWYFSRPEHCETPTSSASFQPFVAPQPYFPAHIVQPQQHMLSFGPQHNSSSGDQGFPMVCTCKPPSDGLASQFCYMHFHAWYRARLLGLGGSFTEIQAPWFYSGAQAPSYHPHPDLSSFVGSAAPHSHHSEFGLTTMVVENETGHDEFESEPCSEPRNDRELSETVCFGRVSSQVPRLRRVSCQSTFIGHRHFCTM